MNTLSTPRWFRRTGMLLYLASMVLIIAGCAGGGNDGAGYSQAQSFSTVTGTSTYGTTSTSLGPDGGTAYHGIAGNSVIPPGSGTASGDLELDFPQGALNSVTSVALSDQVGAAAPLNKGVVQLHAHKMAFSASALPSGMSAKIHVRFPFIPDKHYRAAVGYCINGVFVVLPATVSAAGIDGDVPVDSELLGGKKEGTFTAEISFLQVPEADEPRADPPMIVSKLDMDTSTGACRWTEYEGNWQGTKNVLLVHGIKGSSADLLALGAHLKKAGTYEGIYAVDYKLGYHIDSLGAKLASVISSRTPAGTKIDVLAHSMGGLVARSALENHDASAQTARFISMGSPHNGVTAAFWLSLIAYGIFEILVPEINDLSSDSEFLKTLNSGSRVNCVYYGAVGTDPEQLSTYWTVKIFGKSLVQLLIGGSFGSTVDGMVGAKSAGYDISNKCTSWSTQSYPVNHSYIRGGDQGQQLYETVFQQIDKWLAQ